MTVTYLSAIIFMQSAQFAVLLVMLFAKGWQNSGF